MSSCRSTTEAVNVAPYSQRTTRVPPEADFTYRRIVWSIRGKEEFNPSEVQQFLVIWMIITVGSTGSEDVSLRVTAHHIGSETWPLKSLHHCTSPHTLILSHRDLS